MRMAVLLVLGLTVAVWGQQTEVPIRTVWSAVVVSPGGDRWGDTQTLSAHRMLRTEAQGEVAWPYDPSRISRTFHVEEDHVLLGEPVVVTFTLWNRGTVAMPMQIGGNYRARGRDDNFRLLLQRDDGTFAGDPYGPLQFWMGGLMGSHSVEAGASKSLYVPLQQWCALEQAGHYTLHCLYSEPAMFPPLADGAKVVHREPPPSPVKARMPKALVEHLGAACDTLTDYAAITLDVIEGSPDERAAMHRRWLGRVSFADDDDPSTFHHAAKLAMLFARQTDWLDVIQRDAAPRADRYPVATAMAMNPHPQAWAMLLDQPPDAFLNGTYWLPADRKLDAVPHLISLMDATHELRIQRLAAQRLAHVTGQVFDPRLLTADTMALTAADFAAMQARFATWWQQQRDAEPGSR